MAGKANGGGTIGRRARDLGHTYALLQRRLGAAAGPDPREGVFCLSPKAPLSAIGREWRRVRAQNAMLSFAMLVLSLAPAAAQDAMRPGAGSPFAVQDAFPQSRGALQLEGTFGYERGRGGSDSFEPMSGLEYGLTDDLELRLDAGYTLGDASRANSGTLVPGLRWRLVDEDGWRPALALQGEVVLPFGAGDMGAVTELTAIASRTTGSGPGAWGVHVNAAWLARPDSGQGERQHGYRFGAAVSHVVARDTRLAAAYSQETQDRGERDLSLIEAGLEQRLGGDTSLAFAVGTGLNDDSPRLRLLVSLKLDFDLLAGQ